MLWVLIFSQLGVWMTEENVPSALDLESIVKFQPDEPLAGDSAPEFGHKGVAETLAAIVRRCNPPFTVGLYGSWGTGKSSVVEMVRGLLEPSIPTVVIDVWKFQDDSLRRIVLKELHHQGRTINKDLYDQGTVLDERVEQQTSLATQFKLGVELAEVKKDPATWRRAKRVFWGLGTAVIVVLISALMFPLQVGPVVASVFAGVAAVLATLSAVAVLLTPKTRTWSKGKYADPYEFEKEFLRLVHDGYKSAPRVLVVFDNLDRVDDEKTIEVLTTIKTFLESKPRGSAKAKTVFLVPCDDEAIREQVQNRFHDGSEFLRKFFNVSVRLPEFIGTELEGYALRQLTETRIPALRNPQVAWMIAKAFLSNPRQVKQFVNVLVAEYLLVNRRSALEELPPGFAEKNVLSLTLFQLLRTRFPEALANELEPRPERVDLQDQVRLNLQCKEMKAFRDEVSHYAAIDDFTPWLTLRSSKYEVNLPGVDRFLTALTYADLKEAEEFIASIKDYSSVQNDLSCAVQDRADSIRQTTSFVEFLSTLLAVLGPEGRSLNGTTMDQLLGRASRLVKSEPQLTVARLEPLLVSNRLEERSFGCSAFVDAWADVLKGAAESEELRQPKREFLVSVVKVLTSHDDWFEDRWADIGQSLPAVAGKDDELLRILAEGAGVETWIEPPVAFSFADHMAGPGEVAGALPESVPVASPELFAERIELLRTFPPAAIIDTVANRVLRAAVQVMDGSNDSETNADAWLSLTRSCRASLGIVRGRVSEGAIEDEVLNDFTRVVKNVLTSSQNPAAHREAIQTLIDLGDTERHPNRNELVEFIGSFISQAPIQEVRDIVDYAGGPAMPRWTECRPHLLDRCAADTALYDAVLGDAPENARFDLMSELLPRITEHVLRSIPAASLSEHDTIVVCESAGDQSRNLSGDQLVSVLAAMAPLLGIKGMDYVLRDFADGIGRLLMTGDESLASAALRLLRENPDHMAEPERARELTLTVSQWFASIGDKNQPPVIDALVLLQRHLSPEERDGLVATLFDQNVRDEGHPGVVRHALLALAELGVRYDDRPANFLDIKAKATGTEDGQMAKAVQEGLAALRPKPLSGTKAAREFWKWQRDFNGLTA